MQRGRGQTVNVLQGEAPKPVTIFYEGGGQQALAKAPIYPTPRVVTKVPTLFRYTNDKVVPWNYTSQAVVQESQAATKQKQDLSVNDIVGTGGLTRSGRCYVSGLSGVKKGDERTKPSGLKVTISKKKMRRIVE